MILKKWEELPIEMQTEEVRKYYNILKKKQLSLFLKRIFDIFISIMLLFILFPLFLILAIVIKVDSEGPVFYRQVRVTQYNKDFHILKFRTMVKDADKGSQVTISKDSRITHIGEKLRKFRLDEISQLINVMLGTMTFVSTRPEVRKYTKHYTQEMMATFLLPAGVTSLASIYFKDEAELLKTEKDVDMVYIEKILPIKMYYNLKAIEEFSFWNDIKIMIMTVFAVLGKKYKGNFTVLDNISEVKRVDNG